MSKLNTWKTVFQRNKKIFNRYYPEYIHLDEFKKSRYGFYLFILGTMFDIDNKVDLEEHIIDSDFNRNILSIEGNDNQVDSIFVDDESKKIYIMNFKYRDNYKENSCFSLKDVDGTLNFLSLINDSDYNSNLLNNEKLKPIFNDIRELINDTSQIYDFYFYFISNEDISFSKEVRTRLHSIERERGITIEQLSLDDIYEMGNKKLISTNAKLLIEMDKLSLFKNDNYTTNNSYIMNISLFELIRITSKNEEYRESVDLKTKDDFNLSNFSQEKSQLRDNVRGFLGFTDYNKNIENTLKDDVNNFFIIIMV